MRYVMTIEAVDDDGRVETFFTEHLDEGLPDVLHRFNVACSVAAGVMDARALDTPHLFADYEEAACAVAEMILLSPRSEASGPAELIGYGLSLIHI